MGDRVLGRVIRGYEILGRIIWKGDGGTEF